MVTRISAGTAIVLTILTLASCGRESPKGNSGQQSVTPSPASAQPKPPSPAATAVEPRSERRRGFDPSRSLADLIPPGQVPVVPEGPRVLPLPSIDEAAVASLGIRRISGDHLTLYTDLPLDPTIDELPNVFAAAVPQWCAYFGVTPAYATNWKVVGYLMQDQARFRRANLLPADLPPFLNGYQRGAEFWLYEQPSAYYRRHLMLHEGTHAFMNWSLARCGPPWYMEGIAELLATHRWQEGDLELGYFPRNKTEVPEWGRIKIVQDDFRAGQGKLLDEILRYDSRAHLRVEPYGWCWAMAAFFENHPAYQQRFQKLPKHVADSPDKFSERFVGWYRDDWLHLSREWQWFVANLDYGYDVEREAIEHRPAEPLPMTGATVSVAVDRGWQSTGLQLAAGRPVQIAATGRYQLGQEPKTWWCEPDGVTIRYARGQPLGMLIGAVVNESESGGNHFLSVEPIGSQRELIPQQDGTLYLRVNDASSELRDNQGEVSITIKPLE